MEAVKSAPLVKILRARALAAYEQEELTIPKMEARPIAAGERVPNKFFICDRVTKACTAPESEKPSTNAQKVS